MSKFTKVYRKWHAKNNRKYDSAREYHKALMRKFGDWQPPKSPKSLVEVPQIVSDFIKAMIAKGLKPLINSSKFGELGFTEEKLQEILYWIKEHQEEYMRAWLYGYTVEKEQFYEVVFYVDEEDDRCLLMKTGKTILFEYESQNEGHYKQQFTEQEIKSIDKRYWSFAVKVKEVNP